ncbi:hypothetical protein HMI55_004111 [Coelomomyces lativittatus]|nr:hypothetical protein HMI55_004111 [Coelomomyces lativittatus]KAJ1503299.1 hypothetical protein HMI56_002219 [Coelomomyces lativittatus]
MPSTSSSILCVPKVEESIVIHAPIEFVWKQISDSRLGFWTSHVANSEIENKAAPTEVGGVRKLTFKDKTVQKIKLVSYSELDYSLSYEVIESNPSVSYTSALHHFKLYRVTTDQSTFVHWSAEFSNDAGADVVTDTKYKKLDGLKDLKTFCMEFKKSTA